MLTLILKIKPNILFGLLTKQQLHELNGHVVYIETDLKTIEIMRREKEFAKMDNGYMSISYQEDGEFITIKTSDKYKEYLEKNDNEKGSMICRGHGL